MGPAPTPQEGRPLDPEAQKKSVFLKLRATDEDRVRWQGIAENKGVSLSELMRSSLDGLRLRKRREPPTVAPELLRACPHREQPQPACPRCEPPEAAGKHRAADPADRD